MVSNRRRHKRLANVNSAISVKYRCGLMRLRKRDAICVINISGGGIKLCLPEKLKLGARLTMEIRLAGEKEALPAKGEVAWTNEAEMKNYPKACFEIGIRFIEIDPLSIGKIYNYFKEHSLAVDMV